MDTNRNITTELLDKARKKIILPIDTTESKTADSLIKTLGPHVGYIKVGLATMTAIGGPIITQMATDYGAFIFYDGKFNDIPATTADATNPLSLRSHIKMMNVHATSGDASITEAVKNRGDMHVLVVTVLTSISNEECEEIFNCSAEETVLKFARKAVRNGAQGIVCSPQELLMLKTHPELDELVKVTPAIQPLWMKQNDQKRFMTPYDAIMSGANYLVIGRAITKPPKEHGIIQGDPLKALELIIWEIAEALYDLEMKNE